MIIPENLVFFIFATPFVTWLACLILRKISFLKKFFLIVGPVILNYLIYLSFFSEAEIFTLAKISKNMQIVYKLEPVSQIFLAIISILWLVTNIYSLGIISAAKEEKIANERGFFEYLNFSIFLVVCLALAGNLFTLFCFYELLTFATYPLIIYYRSEESFKSGKTYLYYLLGSSCFLLLPVIVILSSFEPNMVFNQEKFSFYNYFNNFGALFSLMLVLGIAKMAVFPLYKWLPASMVAPAPVSGLLHSVTIVKAGIFTLIKISVYLIGFDNLKILLSNNVLRCNILTYLSGFTIIFASLKSLKYENFKKILAYSTISQISNCLLAFSLSNKIGLASSILQIISHSFAKITWFFSVGIIQLIYQKNKYTECGNLYKKEKTLAIIMTINGLSLMSMPPFFGFWGKYHLLNSAIFSDNWPVVIFACLSSILTALYILPMIYYFIFAEEDSNFSKIIKLKPVEAFCLYLPIIFTTMVSLMGGISANYFSKFVEEKLG